MLEAVGEEIWTAVGPIARDFGMPFPTRMVIVRLHDGTVWIDSPVAAGEDTWSAIRALGPVRYLSAGTPRHAWRLERCRAFAPDAELWLSPRPPGRARRLGGARLLGDEAPEAWAPDVEQIVFRGSAALEEVVFYHRPSRTVIMGDLVQSHRLRPGHPLVNAVVRWSDALAPDGGVPRDIRATFRDLETARRSLRAVLAWDFDRLVIGHGDWVQGDARAFVARALGWLGTP